MPALDFVVAIPSRYAASRLPGKPLSLIAGTPMIVHVARRALAAGAREVIVATDDERIAAALKDEEVTVCMTRSDHVSGTDRLAECADLLHWPDELMVVNLQGDEPFAPSEGIRAVAHTLATQSGDMATLVTSIVDCEQLFDPNVVKVVRDDWGQAMYFSRAPIPWQRDRFARDRVGEPGPDAWRHIGIYAYRVGFLRQFAALRPGRLEQLEALEQLRVLEAGHRIATGVSPVEFPPGVDTEADLARADAFARASIAA
jgi:3-deoxy-manno-octulosonate cytidylyltransferase (CMP-KDO synthetase)